MNAVRKNAMNVVVEAHGIESLKEIGFTEDFLNQEEMRTFHIARATGKPVLEEVPTVECSAIDVRGPIYSYFALESKEDKAFFIIIGVSDKTFFVVVRGQKHRPVVFYAPYRSESAAEAVVNLLKNNMIKGPNFYSRTANLFPNLFPKLLQAVFREEEGKLAIPLIIRARKNVDVESVIEFDLDNPANTTVLIKGEIHPLDINRFPQKLVNQPTEKVENGSRRGEMQVRSARTSRKKPKVSDEKLEQLKARFTTV